MYSITEILCLLGGFFRSCKEKEDLEFFGSSYQQIILKSAVDFTVQTQDYQTARAQLVDASANNVLLEIMKDWASHIELCNLAPRFVSKQSDDDSNGWEIHNNVPV